MRQADLIWQTAVLPILRILVRNLSIIAFLSLSMIGMFTAYWYFSPNYGSAETALASGSSIGLSAPIYKETADQLIIQRLPQSPGPILIGIIAGHRESDSGAVCDDGLTEVDVNQKITDLVLANLREKGVQVELLSEFDEKLLGYRATAVVSIHADSCQYFNELATGYKIAGSSLTDSQALEDCMEQSYASATELPYHANTITEHMTNYHAFRKIAPGTPAIILEVGFMNLDRQLLTSNAEVPAQGITNGIMCYLNSTRADMLLGVNSE